MSAKLQPAPPALAAAFDAHVARLPGAAHRKMFGCPAGFVGRRMFACLFDSSVVLKLPEADRSRLAELGGRPFEPMPGRVMGEFVVLPAALSEDGDRLHEWLVRAAHHVAALPRKPPSARETGARARSRARRAAG